MEVLTKLEVKDLSHSYGSHRVLKGLNFAVGDGEFLSILGPSGCGKTTILRNLIGLVPPDSGSIFKDGLDITRRKPSERGMGIVFQNYALFQNMTALGNVEYALRFNENFRGRARQIAQEMLALVGLEAFAAKKPAGLSGGQQQRVAIARTLALNPEIILFDEPMSALDAAARLSLREELKGIQRRFNSTMIYVTHDQEEAFALSDRIMVMDRGEIQQIDTPRNLIERPANAFVSEFVVDNLRRKINSLAQYVEITR
ncbi:MAG: ABC transporter ATP-binding protein [Spirochaetaceae bacterium]|jgi:ABC-type Fe3+/spermidine/putrescine transport system ATPase subunit|nr:ABC transporter ATP-binding protein [Spirochaetaceae bacterium]